MLPKFFRKREVVYGTIFSVLLVIFVLLGWLNHRDFINAVVRESQEKLLVLVEAQAQSLSKNTQDIGAEEGYVQGLVSQIDRQDKVYVLILDTKGNVVVSPDNKFRGKNIFGMLSAIKSSLRESQARNIFSRMIAGGVGTAVFNFWSEANPPKLLKMIVAFSPVRIKGKLWSLAVFEEYDSIYGFVERNTRDNVVIFILILLVLFVWAYILFRIQRAKTQLETTATALGIINKQLHLQAYQGHRLEQDIMRQLRGNRDKKA